uniref:DMT family transporter n=1 Tax=uncultured Alistipes sp. TaxID=538949 RepID=UPI00261739B9
LNFLRRGLAGRLRGVRLRDELLLAAAGLTGGSLYFLTENIALEYAPASNVSLIVCTAPVWTALLMSLVYRSERMTRRQTAGCALAFVGVVLVVLNGRFVLHLSPRGDLLALSAALLWMLYSLVIKRLGDRLPVAYVTRKVFFYGIVTILPWFAWEPFDLPAATLRHPAVWGNLLFLGVVASLLCYVLWNAAMTRLGAVRTTNYIYLNPLVTMLTAALVIDERITPAALCGAALILSGMWLAERERRRK